ncbi:interleukin-21 [Suncus etruscus]|uniref:interleukin-21 n=1 Tax=Suncus etruscus TaxID=109475 RepID=UPI00210FA92D|nr:interleukin-21 [Suncus etruscus]
MAHFGLCLLLALLGTQAHVAAILGPDRLLIRMRQLLDITDHLRVLVDKLGPTTLPAPQDVKRHCERSAFSCFQKAPLQPVNAGENEKIISLLTKQLRRKLPPAPKHATRRHKHRDACPPCDSYEKTTTKEFLERLKILLQKMIHERLS